MRRIALIVSLLMGAATSGLAQTGATNGEWRAYGGDAGSTRYAPLDQITRDNVGDLEIAWRWKTDNFGPRPDYNYQATPLMVGGTLYVTAGTGRDVVAIDAATGETLWLWRYDEGERGDRAPRKNHRGVAYWTDGTAARILYITAGYRLISLDAATGYPDPAFGDQGVVDLFDGLDRPRPEIGQIGASSPPMVVGNVAVIGSALSAFARTRENIAGFVRGYDVRTGERRWIFHTIPLPGELGNETWENDSWRYTGNAGAWAPMAADPELGYVYLPLETPTNDLYGGDRPGDNLFAESLVALDAATGERVWHYQFIHHGIWDWDIPTAPMLVDITVDGREIKAIAQVTKQAWTYVFDRVTGEPVWPIEERAVPGGDVPGEWYAPTQPFPTKPAPFDRQGITNADLIDFTAEIKAEAVRIASEFRMGPIFTPPTAAGDTSVRGLLMVPGLTGGANWQGGAVDAETGVLYVSSITNPHARHGPTPDRRVAEFCGGPRSCWQPTARGGGHRCCWQSTACGARRLRDDGTARPPAREATVGPDHRHRPQHRRAHLDEAERRGARLRQEPPGARRPRHPADRQGRARGDPRDEDAHVRGRRVRPLRGAARHRRADVSRTRQADGRGHL